jgi:hypothetical protein
MPNTGIVREWLATLSARARFPFAVRNDLLRALGKLPDGAGKARDSEFAANESARLERRWRVKPAP